MKELILLVGCPASGKSTFTKREFGSYTRINLDTLKTRSKEIKAFKAALDSGESIIVDNTNPTIVSRERYITLASKYGYKIKLYIMNTLKEVALERNEVRDAKVPKIAIYSYFSRYEPPTLDEGICEIYTVQVVGDGYNIININS